MKKTKLSKKELQEKAFKVAIEDVDRWDDREVADYIGAESDEIDFDYRSDAVSKRAEELLELWEEEGIENE